MAAICVFCASSTRIATSYVETARAVGTEIARRGHTLVSGGGNISSMGAVAQAARAAGATTVGVIPRQLLDLEVGDVDSDELLVVDDMRTRKGLMDSRSDAFLALPGGIGTLEELLEVWVARTLGMHDKPVVVLDPDDLYAPLRAQVDLLVERGFVRSAAVSALVWTREPGEALDEIEAAWAGQARYEPAAEEVLEAEP